MRFKNKEAVSPVIGVILMVAITVLLAAVVYIWVIGLIPGGKTTPVTTYSVGATDEGYKVTINSASDTISVKGVKCYVTNPGGSTTAVTVDEIYTNYVEGVQFIDNNVDGRLSAGDMFKINKADSGATSGDKLVLTSTSTGEIILQAQFP